MHTDIHTYIHTYINARLVILSFHAMLDASLCVSVLVLNGHFYYHAYVDRNFTSAVTIASNQVISGLTAHLITVTSFVEFIFVASCLGTSWLGMSDSAKEGLDDRDWPRGRSGCAVFDLEQR